MTRPQNGFFSGAAPVREWVPECFTEDGALVLKPVQSEEGEPLTFGEVLRFWGVVWVCCILGGLGWGVLIAYLRA